MFLLAQKIQNEDNLNSIIVWKTDVPARTQYNTRRSCLRLLTNGDWLEHCWATLLHTNNLNSFSFHQGNGEEPGEKKWPVGPLQAEEQNENDRKLLFAESWRFISNSKYGALYVHVHIKDDSSKRWFKWLKASWLEHWVMQGYAKKMFRSTRCLSNTYTRKTPYETPTPRVTVLLYTVKSGGLGFQLVSTTLKNLMMLPGEGHLTNRRSCDLHGWMNSCIPQAYPPSIHPSLTPSLPHSIPLFHFFFWRKLDLSWI